VTIQGLLDLHMNALGNSLDPKKRAETIEKYHMSIEVDFHKNVMSILTCFSSDYQLIW
jgi:hypothetical protein